MEKKVTWKQVQENFKEAQICMEKMQKSDHHAERIALQKKAWIPFIANMPFYKGNFLNYYKENGLEEYFEEDFDGFYLDTVIFIFEHFDPTQGSLEHYFQYIWSKRRQGEAGKRIKENVNKSLSMKNHQQNKDDQQQEEDIFNHISENSEDLEEFTEDVYHQINLTEFFVELLGYISEIKKHSMGRNSKAKYFRMFYTDYITMYCKTSVIGRIIKNREATIFDGIDKQFLDFYMSKICRCFHAIAVTRLKNIGEIRKKKGNDERDRELKIPLEGIVYEVFLNVSPGSVSQKRKEFAQLVEENGLDQYLRS